MKKFGFFEEFRGEGPALAPLMNPPYRWQADVSTYLESGRVVSWSPQLIEDPFAMGESAGTDAIQTDGEWVWPAELAHIVRRHGIMVPDAFLSRMKRNHWQSPDVSDAAVTAADEAARE
jgi:hypothetical protein